MFWWQRLSTTRPGSSRTVVDNQLCAFTLYESCSLQAEERRARAEAEQAYENVNHEYMLAAQREEDDRCTAILRNRHDERVVDLPASLAQHTMRSSPSPSAASSFIIIYE